MPVEVSEVHGVKVFRCGALVQGQVLYWTYFYKFDDLLFDCGCPKTANEVVKAVGKVKKVLITHYHEDHVGAAPLLKAERYAPDKSISILKRPLDIPAYRKEVWGQPLPFDAIPASELRNGNIEVIETPGHSFDHVSYLVGDKLFCGDLVINTKQMVTMREEDCVQTIESLKRVLNYDFKYAFTGMGVSNRDDVEAYLDHLLRLKKKAEELYREGKNVEEIVNALFPNPPQIILLIEQVSKKELARENMVKSLLGLRP
jgi:glyoxylase-like metal-dependent hydrolase (beta-lactamase superfamily II)